MTIIDISECLYSHPKKDLTPLKNSIDKFTTPSPVKKNKKILEEEEFSINTIHAKNERFTLREVCRREGWKETKNLCEGSLMWYINGLRDIDIQILSYKTWFYNRYPRSTVICRKRQFHTLMKKYQRFFPESFDFFPKTYILPDEYKTFRKYFDENHGKIMIAKPSKGKGGDGIFFVQSTKDIQKDTAKAFDYIAQEYIANPLLIDNKKFDLRLYLMIKGVNTMEAYIAFEGMARFCTEDYTDPRTCNHGEAYMDDANLFGHLTNYWLNRENEKYINIDDFKNNDSGSKRLLTTVLKTLENTGVDVDNIKLQIKDISTKIVMALQPFLINAFHSEMGTTKDINQNWFHIFGLDVLIDDNHKCWVMEINACPSFSYFFEHTVVEDGEAEMVRSVSEIDKYLKTTILKQAIKILKNERMRINESSVFEQVFPPKENSDNYRQFTVYNDARFVFELLAGFKKPEHLTLSQFQKLWSFPGMRSESLSKPEYGILYQNYKKKGTKNSMSIEGFNNALEHIGRELFPDMDNEHMRLALVVKRVLDYAMD